ncbi:YbaK/EbsC family protein [Candidatus Nanohalovita haloferacivicina]|uniref:YbaK/EbsC family protein n=1 Tax=Candidatus Nanohalovita haloferacivicina TaxID=2978046 RepID=UPI00325FCE02|nr:Cys-tRNA(Pro) deacylase, prolyl-tRNA editing enzyme YbaK/EbsC [Candidatus Nanohalobia archaeon BNXNv]
MKADEFLEEKGLDFEVVEQDNPTLDCDDAARERGVKTSQIAKSLIVDRDGDKIHCVLPGDRKLSAGKFGEHRLVDPEESLEITGQESGTVHPFSSQLEHRIDRKLLERDRISFTTGDSQKGVIIDTEKFRQGLEKADFTYQIKDIVDFNEKDIEELEEKGLDEEEARFVLSRGLEKQFEELNSTHETSLVIGLLEEFGRHDLEYSSKVSEEILSRAERETHMQKLVQAYDREGELPEEKDFSLEKAVEKVMSENSDAVEDYREGKDSALNYLLGQVMKETNGKADGGKARKTLMDKLEA